MISVSESLLTLSEAARSLPGGRVHVSTLHRWRLRGVRGIKLETMMRGGVRMTSMAALERFFVAISAAVDGDHSAAVSTTTKRRQAASQRFLESEGL